VLGVVGEEVLEDQVGVVWRAVATARPRNPPGKMSKDERRPEPTETTLKRRLVAGRHVRGVPAAVPLFNTLVFKASASAVHRRVHRRKV
jgi:hypothetical protein